MEKNITNSREERLSFSDFLATVKWLFVFNFKLSPWAATAQIVIKLILNTSPLFSAYIFARLLDKIIKIVSMPGSNINEIIPLLGLLLSYNLVISALGYVNSYVSQVIGLMSGYRVPVILARHINSLGIQTLENPDVVNKIQRARETIGGISNDFERMLMFVARGVALISALFVIIKIMPIIAMIILFATIPELIS
ncbi:MAG: hypothetical protein Q7S81_01230, partial [bacterium]|nr:hypothetical protein [bacterium]